MPPAPRQVEHIAGGEHQIGDGLLGRWLGRFDVAVHRQRAGGAVDAPALRAVELDDDHVVIVPVDAEALGSGPGGVQVGLHAGPQPALQLTGQGADAGVEFVDGV